jgi:hypothetical protein
LFIFSGSSPAFQSAYTKRYTYYQPIHIYEDQSGKLITTILRPGKRPSGKEIVTILKRIVKRLRAAWPEVGIILRGDAHYNSPVVHDFCDEHNIKFTLGLKTYKPLAKKAQRLIEKAEELYERNHSAVKIYGEFLYQAGSWSSPRRIIVKAEYNHKGSNTRFITTNLEHANRQFIYVTVFCGRGAMELMIKEHKTHLASGRTSCSQFEANQFRVFLHSIAYVLLHALRQRYLRYTQFAVAQFDTIRLKLLKIGARVRQLSTKIKIHLPTSFPYKDDVYAIWRACCSNGFS